MKEFPLIRVFPRRTEMTPTDRYAFVGDPPAWLWPMKDAHSHFPVSVSCLFTWDIPEAQRLKKSWSRLFNNVELGGPALGSPVLEFIPGRFVKEGAVFTFRGCSRSCRFCLVPRREGKLRELPISNGFNILDNNLLACSDTHILQVFNMLTMQKSPAVFSGGLDARFLQPWHVELLKSIRLKEMFFACDNKSSVRYLRRAGRLLTDFSREKKRCYVLIGYRGETPKQARDRLVEVFNLDFLPFAMLYRGPNANSRNTPEFHDLVGKWRSPSAYKMEMEGPRRPLKGGKQLEMSECKNS